jgi:signal transduction histidine kinase
MLIDQPEAADERVQKGLERVLASSQRMTRLIDQLLDFTRARLGGGPELEPRPIDLAALCDQAAVELALAHPSWNVVLESSGDCGGTWDPDRLLQAVSNLIANAGQHGATGEVLVTLDGTQQEGVALAIYNRGSIPAELLPKLFAPFRSQRNRKSGGLGLGLFITKQIILAHGGRIDVTSSDATGTKFSLWLPRRVQASSR